MSCEGAFEARVMPFSSDHVAVRCVDHPTYTGKRVPRVECAACAYIHENAGMWAVGPLGRKEEGSAR